MQHRINISNIAGAVAFILMILAVGFVDGGSYVAGIGCMVAFAVLATVSVREDGQKRR